MQISTASSSIGWRANLTPYVVQFDRDALSDVLLYDKRTGEFWTARSTDSGTRFEYTAGGWSPGWQITPLKLDDGTDDLLLYSVAGGAFYTVSNLGRLKDPGQPVVYDVGGWRLGWSLTPRDDDLLLYDPRTGDTFQLMYTRVPHPFYYWDYVRWPAGLRVLPVRGFRSADWPEYLLYNPQSGLYYVASGLPSETFLYYVGYLPSHCEAYAADFTGDGRTTCSSMTRRPERTGSRRIAEPAQAATGPASSN
jgi:hypothetical protein